MKPIITSGLNKVEVLLALYNYASATDEAVMAYIDINRAYKGEGSLNKAIDISYEQSVFTRINLGAGFRVINVDLEDAEFFDATEYDTLHGQGQGQGQAAKAIHFLKQQEPVILPNALKKRKIGP